MHAQNGESLSTGESIEARAGSSGPRATGLPSVASATDAISNLTLSDDGIDADAPESPESAAHQKTATAKKAAVSKNKKKALAARRLGGTDDIAFGSVSNIDHSVEEPFELNMHSVLSSINNYTSSIELSKPTGLDVEEYAKSIGLPFERRVQGQQQLDAAGTHGATEDGDDAPDAQIPRNIFGPGGPDQIAYMGFGGGIRAEDGPYAFIVCDAFSRLGFKAHPMLNRPLVIEPH
ncbi:hypothetical protein EXIGLDRAFT_767697, partial [Exidia glandulosa HHB12029]